MADLLARAAKTETRIYVRLDVGGEDLRGTVRKVAGLEGTYRLIDAEGRARRFRLDDVQAVGIEA